MDKQVKRVASNLRGTKKVPHDGQMAMGTFDLATGMGNEFGKANLKAMNDDALNKLLESMMNDTDVKGDGRAQIRKMPREHKEMMLLPWMTKKGAAHSSTDALHTLNELKMWPKWSAEQQRQKFQAIKVQISSQMVPWLQKFCDQKNDQLDGYQVLMQIMHNQTSNFLRYKRDVRHLEERLQDQRAHERYQQCQGKCNQLEQNMKNIIQSIYKIANTGFGYKRLQRDVQGAKILCLTLDPLIPASVAVHVSFTTIYSTGHSLWSGKLSQSLG